MNARYDSWLKNSRITEIPARLDKIKTAELLGFQEHDIPVLVAEGLLKPLGKPVPNATKYFATCEIIALAENPKWLNLATQAVYDYWKDKNDNKLPKVSTVSRLPIAA